MKDNKLTEAITQEAIKSRHSVRSYTDEPISGEQKRQLAGIISECNRQGGLHMQLVIEEPQSFGRSRMAHYGKFRNVRNYICLVCKKADDAEQRLGFYGEIVVLLAQQMGLNTCWVALTYSKRNTSFSMADDERLYAVISIGHGATQGTEHKIKTPQQVASPWDGAPSWFRQGVECALLAPSALNQQKFRFKLLSDDKVEATTAWGFFSKMDLGIAKLHFELGTGSHSFDWA